MVTSNATSAVPAATEVIKEHFSPTLEILAENVRQARRAVAHGTQAAEELAEAVAVEVRRHPLRAAAIAAGLAVLAAGVVGFAFGRRVQRYT